MADWSRLTRALAQVENEVCFTWDELDKLVGGMPASATNHRAWWSGDRSHVNAWRNAGFTVARLDQGHEVTFVRTTTQGSRAQPTRTERADGGLPGEAGPHGSHAASHLLLVTCVKEKLDRPAPARDLYTSALFKKERAYAEHSDLPWFILSAEHGLVAPDEWLAPYERYLPDTPRSYRTAWGGWVVERLEVLAGPLRGRTIEIHAGSSYVASLREPLTAKGARLFEPLNGLTMGQRLAWYDMATPALHAQTAVPKASDVPDGDETRQLCALLSDPRARRSPAALLADGSDGLRTPGLYSWWVDEAGAIDLGAGLGMPVTPGLVYAGLAGATRWPSGRRSSNTLWSRITGMHLGSNHELSTLRHTLGAILASAGQKTAIDEAALTEWMHRHLTVITVPFRDADRLGQIEDDVLGQLDPPLNLRSVPSSPVREKVSELRRARRD